MPTRNIELGRLYLDGNAGAIAHQAARWFRLAATKGHCRAEAALGDMLFHGQVVPRQAARGLMWLTLGRDCAGTGTRTGSSRSTTAPSSARATTNAPWRWSISRDWIKGRRD